MRPYSLDLRERIVAAVQAGQNQSEVARRFALSASSVSRYVAQQNRCQNLAAKLPPGARRRLDESTLAALTERVQKQPDATLLEHQQWLHEEHRLDVSIATLHRSLLRAGFTHKKSQWLRLSETKPSALLGEPI